LREEVSRRKVLLSIDDDALVEIDRRASVAGMSRSAFIVAVVLADSNVPAAKAIAALRRLRAEIAEQIDRLQRETSNS